MQHIAHRLFHQSCAQRLPAPFTNLRPVQCDASNNTVNEKASTSDSSSFGNSLRRGFKPIVEKAPRSKPASKPTSSDEGKGPLVLGGDLSKASWEELDAKVNQYPGLRTFTAIGTGGDDFASAMVSAISLVVGDVSDRNVSLRPSSAGRYLSVKITARVASVEEVVQIFKNMKSDARLKWLI